MKPIPATGIIGLNSIMRSRLKDIAASTDRTENEKCKALVAPLLDRGLKTEEVAEILDIKRGTVINWKSEWSSAISKLLE